MPISTSHERKKRKNYCRATQIARIAELLETLVIVGQARKPPDGRDTGKV